tara:strand:+ start:480 stop:734 length:255 start_codon:yes stop_codon:yes gene_type:complete
MVNMKKYNITIEGDFFKVEVSDKYGCETTVYEKNILDASKFVYDWWEDTENRKKSNDLMNKAILNCIKLDKKSGILTGNRDGLD